MLDILAIGAKEKSPSISLAKTLRGMKGAISVLSHTTFYQPKEDG